MRDTDQRRAAWRAAVRSVLAPHPDVRPDALAVWFLRRGYWPSSKRPRPAVAPRPLVTLVCPLPWGRRPVTPPAWWERKHGAAGSRQARTTRMA